MTEVAERSRMTSWVSTATRDMGRATSSMSDADGLASSLWHDVPLHSATGSFNGVCLAPRGAMSQFEVVMDDGRSTVGPMYRSFPEASPCHIALLPQTWTDGLEWSEECGEIPLASCPLEVLDISSQSRQVGDVYSIDLLAAMAVADAGKMKASWTLIGVSLNDTTGVEELQHKSFRDWVDREMCRIRQWLCAGRWPNGKLHPDVFRCLGIVGTSCFR